MSRKKGFLLGIIGVFSGIFLLVGIIFAVRYGKYVKDILQLRSKTYDTVFLSMYPIDEYEEADYELYRGMKIAKSEAVIENTKILDIYMEAVSAMENVITTAYLGIDPMKANVDDIFHMTLSNPEISFEIVLAYPRMEYWLSMDAETCLAAWERYRDLAGNILGLENVRVYFFGNDEWLLCNPENYLDTFRTNAEVSLLLMCNTDYQHNNILNVENFHPRFNKAWEIIERYRMEPETYVDASDVEIIFFGDSVIGNYVDSLSVPGVVNGLTSAAVYNCGYGGQCAALSEKSDLSIAKIAEKFVKKDLAGIPEDKQIYAGMKAYFDEKDHSKKTIFVINYGLNDFFDGVPVETEDLYDEMSYGGSLRIAVSTLQTSYPEAEIILLTPNKTIQFNFGEDKQSDEGGKLEDYANTLLSLGEELNVYVLDNYRDIPINLEKHWELLADGTHPNEQGRFLMGQSLSKKLEEVMKEK